MSGTSCFNSVFEDFTDAPIIRTFSVIIFVFIGGSLAVAISLLVINIWMWRKESAKEMVSAIKVVPRVKMSRAPLREVNVTPVPETERS